MTLQIKTVYLKQITRLDQVLSVREGEKGTRTEQIPDFRHSEDDTGFCVSEEFRPRSLSLQCSFTEGIVRRVILPQCARHGAGVTPVVGFG